MKTLIFALGYINTNQQFLDLQVILVLAMLFKKTQGVEWALQAFPH